MKLAGRVLVVALLLAATWSYLELKSHAEPTPVREPLEQLPYEIVGWHGTREPDFDSSVMSILGVDDYALAILSPRGHAARGSLRGVLRQPAAG